MTILSIKNLSKSYKNKHVLDNISLTIDSPGIWALVGPSGVGKTTFLNVLTNMVRADLGDIELVGKSNRDQSVFREVAYLQDPSILFDYLSGYDHLNYLRGVYNLRKTRVKEVAQYVGMEKYLKKPIKTYSFGMKQRLLLAMALIHKPKLLFLDEPFHDLHSADTIHIRTILLELKELGTTVFMTSHALSDVDQLTQNILFLHLGKLTEVSIRDHEAVYYRFLLSDPKKAKELLDQEDYYVEETESGLFVQLQFRPLQKVIQLLLSHDIRIIEMHKEISGAQRLYDEYFEVKGPVT
ncbi:ABC transporter ATP-binding protein [Alkalicoccobacillus murimartini]|uniref:ABC-2 type transport system ATP-binding protein n=1 Tax=Alkalicoccobacillus murimartini TaxID=171685 RepID=A0ABT9YKJ3_9BACI|nr:ABC transporter ATP-binding protein [Alkalicoccobacillus murimartini]MDQ0208390.1 ABC-2 type transport system ATP-binding protein [Alkalicoccobacillus murimartini]